MRVEVFLYILVMAAVTYLIRMLPLTLIRRKITNRTLRSFLYYVPYATLSAMTFPAILTATGSAISAALGFAAALILAFRGKSARLFQIGGRNFTIVTESLVFTLSKCFATVCKYSMIGKCCGHTPSHWPH